MTGLEPLLIPAAIGVGSAVAGTVGSMLMKPKMPAFPTVTLPDLPDPVAPPNAPLTPSQTAALQRARARQSGAIGNKDIVLSSQRMRREDDASDLVSRTTLVGR